MYGRHYESMYNGSLVGAGSTVFAVWGYIIAHMKPPEFDVELNPKLLAFILGDTNEAVLSAIDKLCSPDPKSRTKVEEGRRLLKKGEYLYHVVNGELYAKMRSHAERKAIWSELKRQQRQRQRNSGTAEKEPEEQLPTAEELNKAESEAKKSEPIRTELFAVEQVKKSMNQIELIYDAYPKKVGKPEAFRAIRKALEKVGFDYLLEKTKAYAMAVSKTSVDSRYIPHPSTWYNQERFNDDIDSGVGITTRTIVCSYGRLDVTTGTVQPVTESVDVKFMPDGSVDAESIPKEPRDLYIAVQEKLSELGLW